MINVQLHHPQNDRKLWRPDTVCSLSPETRINRPPVHVPIRLRSALSIFNVDKTPKTLHKMLVNVTVQRSSWPLRIMALAEWNVEDLVRVVLKQYVEEGRKPALVKHKAESYGLHFTQYCVERLDPKAKLTELDSRSFFLCPKVVLVAENGSLSLVSASNEAENRDETRIPWISFMEFVL